MEIFSTTQKEVQAHYGKDIKELTDLRSTSCLLGEDKIPQKHQEILAKLHPEVISRFFGCGSPLPENIKGLTILDLGSGSGRDVYLASGLVGETGKVIGIDMTEEQIEVAKRHQEFHREAFGYAKSNVEFIQGTIEDLKVHNIPDNSVDIVISNCVVNLVDDKSVVIKEIFRVLKEGGELYFSDIYVDRRIPDCLKKDRVLWGECISGALYEEDFRRIMQAAGFLDYRVTKRAVFTSDDQRLKDTFGDTKFYSLTMRAFKLSGLEDRCENYGQCTTYNGGIEGCEEEFHLDSSHFFKRGEPVKICKNTALMLTETRFTRHFVVTKPGQHRGLFETGVSNQKEIHQTINVKGPPSGGCC